MTEITLEATNENVAVATAFIEEQLVALGCAPKIKTQINIAVIELFSNIARHAYKPDVGSATVSMEVTRDPLCAVITFTDSAPAFNPLKREDPDTSLPLKKRRFGGMGILMVKKSMDDISYEYRDGHNILRIKKLLESN